MVSTPWVDDYEGRLSMTSTHYNETAPMKTVHVYCSYTQQWVFVDEPINAEMDKKITVPLTWSTVAYAISKFANGEPPYTLTVPAEFLAHVYETWGHPTRLVRVVPKPNRTDNYHCDTCELQLQDMLVVFHMLRYDSTPDYAVVCRP